MNSNQPFLSAKHRKYVKYLVIALFMLSMILADIFGISLPDMSDESDGAVYPPGWEEQAYSSSLETDTLFTSLATTGNLTVGGVLDINGTADGFVIDADGDTTLSADTDDTINVEVSGADDFVITANKFEVQSGSVMDINGAADGLVIDADADTSISADTDDTINIEVAGADDFVITANTLTASSGSSIALASGAFPLGYATTGSQLVYGSDAITGTATAAHGLTTVTFASCTLGEDPEAGAGDGAMCTVSISANVVTLDVWQDDFVTAATEVSVVVHWLVVGVP